jgi:predicted  nucleic acid-binding Zn-ribbon protein
LLRRAERKVADDLSAADDELDLLEPELKRLQERLAEVQSKMKNTLARHARLRKQQKFLKERGFKMSEHDAELLRILDEKTSSPGQAAPSALEIQQLASTAENPNFDQMFQEIAQLPPSFWDGLDVSGLSGSPSPSVGGTVEPAGGSPSGSR